MAHNLFRLVSSVVNQPLLVTPEYSEFAINFLIERSAKPEMAISGVEKTDEEWLAYNADNHTGLISILGPLTYQPIVGMCGEQGYSYQRIQSDFDQMVELGAKRIILDLDTPGGMAYGCFETAAYMRRKADDNGVELIAYVDGTAASAGYALASVCHKVIANPYADVGSIGVVVCLANVIKAEKRVGVERTYVYAGKSKIPYDKDGNFSEEFLNDVQEKVDTLYSSFIEHVSNYRKLSPEDIRNTEAKVFSSEQAKKLGLVDEIMEREEFANYLADLAETGNEMSLTNRLFGKETTQASANESEASAQLVQMQAVVESLQADLASAKTSEAALAAQLEAAVAELTSIKEAEKAKLAAELQAKQDKRKAELTQYLGDEQGEQLFQATKDMPDAAFGLMVENFKLKVEKEKSDNAQFKEIGAGGNGAEFIKEDATTRILKEKYGK